MRWAVVRVWRSVCHEWWVMVCLAASAWWKVVVTWVRAVVADAN